jgi:ubiquinone/menaquinone biosynthesis C-methylase UbiE
MAYTFDNPLRRFVHRPQRVLGPHVREGMTVLDMGCGMGYFSIAMARMVGESGRVVAVDLQQQMLDVLRRRARREGVSERIVTRLASPGSIGFGGHVDFALAFWMAHEVQDGRGLFRQLSRILEEGAMLLVTEPVFHVSSRAFRETIGQAVAEGLVLVERPRIRFSHSALFEPRD